MAVDSLIAIGGFLVVVIALIFAGVKTVPQGNNWTVERFGRYTLSLNQDSTSLFHSSTALVIKSI